jgi:Transposase DDE domain group 1
MPTIAKRSSKIRFEFVPAKKQSILGGLPAIEALAQRFGLWQKIRALPGIDPRVRTTHGYSPELNVAQLLYSFCSGGASLADAERLNDEPLARQLARVEHFADQTQLGEWLRKQTDASVAAFWGLISEFIQWVMGQANASRWTYAGRAEVFFDDTQIEVFGPSFEGAKINYNGDLALSWQTLWFGPFLLEGQLDSPGDVSARLPGMLRRHRAFWQERESDFLADSGSSSAEYLKAIAEAGFTHWSVSYNKWTTVPERTAGALPETAWQAARQTTWRNGTDVIEQHAGIRHTPQDSEFTFSLAVARWKKADEMFWRYAFVAHDEGRSDAEAVMARHRLKGGKEQLFKEVLRGLDLHHPPCESLKANRMFYAIAALAYNLMKAVQLLCLPDECQGWTVPTLLKQMVRLPATLVRHARRLVARVEVAVSWLGWWHQWQRRWWQAGAGLLAATG